MGRSGEHIKGLGVGQGVAPFRQASAVPGQCGRVAGDVDDPVRRHPGHGVDDGFVKALSGRVYHDDVGTYALFGKVRGSHGCIGAVEFRILDAVADGILFGVHNGLFNDFHAHHGFGMAGQGKDMQSAEGIPILCTRPRPDAS